MVKGCIVRFPAEEEEEPEPVDKDIPVPQRLMVLAVELASALHKSTSLQSSQGDSELGITHLSSTYAKTILVDLW